MTRAFLTVLMIVMLAMVGQRTAAADEPSYVQVVRPWSWETGRRWMAGDNKDIYMTLRSTADDRLLSAASPIAREVQLHRWATLPDGKPQDQTLTAIDLPKEGWVRLEHGGTRVFLIGLTQPLAPGSSFPLDLRFEKAGAKHVEVEVAVWNAVIRDNVPYPPAPSHRH